MIHTLSGADSRACRSYGGRGGYYASGWDGGGAFSSPTRTALAWPHLLTTRTGRSKSAGSQSCPRGSFFSGAGGSRGSASTCL